MRALLSIEIDLDVSGVDELAELAVNDGHVVHVAGLIESLPGYDLRVVAAEMIEIQS